MLPVEHNGDGFYYVVSYSRHEQRGGGGGRRAPEVARRVMDWRQSQLVVAGVEAYSEYVVAVQAVNHVGPAPRSTVERRVGHSAENGRHAPAAFGFLNISGIDREFEFYDFFIFKI